MQRYGWTALHDVHWPGRPQANIDHIAIGPGGIVIIDAKNWSGTVTVRDGALRRTATSAGARPRVWRRQLPQSPPCWLRSTAPRLAVLCLAAQDHDVQPVAGVDIVGRWQLPEMMLGLPPRLSVYDVADISRFLHRELDTPGPAAGPRPALSSRVPTGRRPPAGRTATHGSAQRTAATGRDVRRDLVGVPHRHAPHARRGTSRRPVTSSVSCPGGAGPSAAAPA